MNKWNNFYFGVKLVCAFLFIRKNLSQISQHAGNEHKSISCNTTVISRQRTNLSDKMSGERTTKAISKTSIKKPNKQILVFSQHLKFKYLFETRE